MQQEESMSHIMWCNQQFLTQICEKPTVQLGLLRYKYHISGTLYAFINVGHSAYIVDFMHDIGNDIYMQIDGAQTQNIDFNQYLSAKINAFC